MGRIKIGEAVTDRNGKARLQYDIRNVHTDFAIEAVYDEYSKRKSIDNVTYTILLETDMCVDTGDPIEISGYLLEDNLPMNQEQLNVFVDDVRVKTVLVNNQDGSYSAELNGIDTGVHTVYVTWNNNKVSSSVETVYVGTCVYELSLTSDKISLDTLDSVTFSGVLTRNDVPWKNQPVEIYDGSTLIDTLTTDNNGAYSKTIDGLTAGNHIFKAVNTRCESDPLNITVNKTNPDLNIEVPLVLVYSDDFLITGLLTDKHNNGVNGKTVQLKIGSTVVDSGVTARVDGVDGIVEFTQCPVHMGTHTFQLAFEGDATYNSVDSQTVTRQVNKETSVITVYTPLNGEEYYYDESIRVTGVLLSDDAEEIEGRTIKVTENGTLITTLTTESNGRFLGDITGLSIDTHSLKFEFEGDEYYTASSIIKSVDVIDYNYDITLSCSTPIIEVGDTATVIATLLKEGAIYAGQTLTYEIKHKDTVIDSGSGVTDSHGQINIDYTGNGIGDVDVNVTYTHLPTLLEKTYVIEINKYYNPDTLSSSTLLPIEFMPLDFRAEFSVYVDNDSAQPDNGAWLEIGRDSRNCLLFGNAGSLATLGTYVRVGGVDDKQYLYNALPVRQWIKLTYTCNNGVHTITDGTNTLTLTNTSITSRNYVRAFILINQMKEILIEPL